MRGGMKSILVKSAGAARDNREAYVSKRPESVPAVYLGAGREAQTLLYYICFQSQCYEY